MDTVHRMLVLSTLIVCMVALGCESDDGSVDDAGGGAATADGGGGGAHGPCFDETMPAECEACTGPTAAACETGPCQSEATLHYDCLALTQDMGCFDAAGNPLPLGPSECCADTGEVRLMCFFANCPDFVACYE